MAKKKQGKKLQAKSSRSFPPNQHYNWLRNQQDITDLERFVHEGRTLKDMATYFGTKVGRVESCLNDYNLLELRKANEKRMTYQVPKETLNTNGSDFVGPPYELSREETDNISAGDSLESKAKTDLELDSEKEKWLEDAMPSLENSLESKQDNSASLFESPSATSDAELRKEVGLPSKPIYQLPEKSTTGHTPTQTSEREPVSSSRPYSPYVPTIDGPGFTIPLAYGSSFVHPSINPMHQSTVSSPATRPTDETNPAPAEAEAETQSQQAQSRQQTTTQPRMTFWQKARSSKYRLLTGSVTALVLGGAAVQATGYGIHFGSSKREHLTAGDSRSSSSSSTSSGYASSYVPVSEKTTSAKPLRYEGSAMVPDSDKAFHFTYIENTPSLGKKDTLVNLVEFRDPANPSIIYRLEDVNDKIDALRRTDREPRSIEDANIERIISGTIKGGAQCVSMDAYSSDSSRSTLFEKMNGFYKNALKQVYGSK